MHCILVASPNARYVGPPYASLIAMSAASCQSIVEREVTGSKLLAIFSSINVQDAAQLTLFPDNSRIHRYSDP